MAQLVERIWKATGQTELPRRDRTSCTYHVYVPDFLAGRSFQLDGEVAADVADAEAAVLRLNMQARALRDTEALARLLLRSESVASSRIEGLEIGARRLLQAESALALGGVHDRRDRGRSAGQHRRHGHRTGRHRRRASHNGRPPARRSSPPPGRHPAGRARRSDAQGAELDRRVGLQPVRRGLRSAALGTRRRVPVRSGRVLQPRLPVAGRPGRDRPRAVRDCPSVHRRQREDRPRSHTPDTPPARSGSARASARFARVGDVVGRLRQWADCDQVRGSGRFPGCSCWNKSLDRVVCHRLQESR